MIIESSGLLTWHHYKVAKVFCLLACCFGVCRVFGVVARLLPKDFWLPACCYGVATVFWAVARELPFSCYGLLPVTMLLWSCQGDLDGCQGIIIQLLRSCGCQHVAMKLLGCSGRLPGRFHIVAKVILLSACCYGIVRMLQLVTKALVCGC